MLKELTSKTSKFNLGRSGLTSVIWVSSCIRKAGNSVCLIGESNYSKVNKLEEKRDWIKLKLLKNVCELTKHWLLGQFDRTAEACELFDVLPKTP